MNALPLVDRLRLDKWLWAARLFKTRALAAEAVDLGRVWVGDAAAKPGRELKAGDRLLLRGAAHERRELVVLALSPVRGPAPLAQALYAETPASLQARQAAAETRRMAPEPAAALVQGRPTKRDRRRLDAARGADEPSDPSPRWSRWSASLDDDPPDRG